MRFHQKTAEVYVPDGRPAEAALSRTTHLAVAAHQDDIEIMAAAPILECYQNPGSWFTGVVVADGRGSPRSGAYANYSDDEMREVRFKEQRKAASVGEYAALVMLDYPSSTVKDPKDVRPVKDLVQILRATQPDLVYTHNLADKHDTHVAVVLRLISAIRTLPELKRPACLYGCEVWRDLDWLVEDDKIGFDLSSRENLQAALLGVFDSQIGGGKRYDLGVMGRRRASATFAESHAADRSLGRSLAMDLTPLITDLQIDPERFVRDHIQRFALDVVDRITRVS